MIIGEKTFDIENHTYIMGILNVTPDSFSDGGKFNSVDAALKHAEKMVEEGADILDVGGESTRPGHIQIMDDEEIERVVPGIERLKAEFNIPVSIDTYKARVAEAALNAGADLVNDIWGLKYDLRAADSLQSRFCGNICEAKQASGETMYGKTLAEVIAEKKIPCCLMHNRVKAEYHHFLTEVLLDLEESVEIARRAGIADDQIILDPGIGFGKTYEMNLEMLKHLSDLNSLGYPVLLGTSRKSVIGLTLDLPVDQREEGTLATTVMGVMSGCAFVRVHDVKANIRAVKMTEAILREHTV